MMKRLVPYIIALLCTGFACTQEVFMSVINWLGSLLMKLSYGWFTALLIILLTIWCGYQLWSNWRKYKYGDAFIASLVFFAVTTLYFRFGSDGFDFVPFVWKIAYVDVLWVLALAFIAEAFVNRFGKKPADESKAESVILLDSPIETPDEDKFDYYSEARHIANTLSQLPEDRAVSVAVLSPWGNGKTSFVNLIKYAIKHGDEGKAMFDHVIVEFNPRQSKNIASIQEDFFKALTEALPNETNVQHKVSNYIENIGIQDVHPLAKVFAGILRESKKDAVQGVNEALDHLGKRLVVFVDDFDRLTDVEIVEVLKLIDNNAAFRHTVFITAYDEKAVSNALKKYEGSNGIAYIDKFFTLRFHLPLRSDVSIVGAVFQALYKIVGKDEDVRSIVNKHYWIIADCVRNLRDVKSFCNMFQIDYAFNRQHKVNFEEYLLLELMKFRYYDDYYALYKKEFIENRSLFGVYNADATYSLKEVYSSDRQGNKPKEKLPRTIHILKKIFSDYKSWDDYGNSTKTPSYRSVQYVRYFEMYFTNRGYGHVLAEGLNSLFAMKEDEEIITFYRQCINQKAQSDIVDFLRYQDWQDITPKGALNKEETFKQFVRLVFLYSAITDDNDTYIHALQLQLIYKDNFEKGYNGMDEQSYRDYLLDVIYNKGSVEYIPLSFLMRVTHTLIAPEDDEKESAGKYLLKSDEVKKKNLELFTQFIETQVGYTAKLSSIYMLCADHKEGDRWLMAQEANDKMRDFLYKDKSNAYLTGFLIFNNDSGRYVSVSFKDVFFKQIFPVNDEGDMFEKYVKNVLPEGDETRKELLAYLKRYRAAGSESTGYLYLKAGRPTTPSNMEIIEGLQF